MWSKILLTLLFLLILVPSIAQKKLIIARPASPAKYVFYEGERIRFKLKGEKFWSEALIQGLGENYIRLHYVNINLSEIEAIDVRGRGSGRFLSTMASVAVIGGGGFAAIDQINRTLVHGQPGVDEKALLIGGALVSAGVIFHLLKRKKVRIGRRFRIRVAEY